MVAIMKLGPNYKLRTSCNKLVRCLVVRPSPISPNRYLFTVMVIYVLSCYIIDLDCRDSRVGAGKGISEFFASFPSVMDAARREASFDLFASNGNRRRTPGDIASYFYYFSSRAWNSGNNRHVVGKEDLKWPDKPSHISAGRIIIGG